MSTRRSLARFSGFLLTRHVALQLCCMRMLTNEIYSAHGWAIPCGQYIANKEHGHGRAATRANAIQIRRGGRQKGDFLVKRINKTTSRQKGTFSMTSRIL